MNLEVMRPGDWFEIEYGFSRLTFYIVTNDPMGERMKIGRPSWCVSSAIDQTYSEINRSRPVHLGRRKLRWWWRFLPIRDLICPFKPFRGTDDPSVAELLLK